MSNEPTRCIQCLVSREAIQSTAMGPMCLDIIAHKTTIGIGPAANVVTSLAVATDRSVRQCWLEGWRAVFLALPPMKVASPVSRYIIIPSLRYSHQTYSTYLCHHAIFIDAVTNYKAGAWVPGRLRQVSGIRPVFVGLPLDDVPPPSASRFLATVHGSLRQQHQQQSVEHGRREWGIWRHFRCGSQYRPHQRMAIHCDTDRVRPYQ